MQEEERYEEDDGIDSEPVTPPARYLPAPVAPVLDKTGNVIWGEEREEPEPHPHSNLDDLFEVPDPEQDNDVFVDDLFELDDETVDLDDDLSDITQVTMEDVMGTPPPRKPKTKFRRTGRDYTPPTSVAGTEVAQ